jgi:hypothetical protein
MHADVPTDRFPHQRAKVPERVVEQGIRFMLYPSRIKEISALRDDLDKYKATLLIALQMHKP